MSGIASLKNSLPLKLYIRLFPAQLLNLVAAAIVRVLGGMMIGRVFGDLAVAAYGVSAPLINVVSMLGALVSGGALLFSAESLCHDDKTEKIHIASTAFTFALLVGALLTSVGLFLAEPTVRLLGATDEILASSVLYLRGISLGFIPMMLTPVMTAFLQLNGETRKPVTASLITLFFCAVLNVIFLVVLRLPFFYASLAGSLPLILSAIYLLVFFMLGFPRLSPSLRGVRRIFILGLVESAPVFIGTVKGMILTPIASAVGGAEALATIAFCGNLNTLTAALFPPAFFTVTTMLLSTFYEENDRESLRRSVRTGFLLSFLLGLFLVLLSLAVDTPLCILFGAENPAFVIDCFLYVILATPPYVLYMYIIKALSCQRKPGPVTLLAAFTNMIIPLSVTFLITRFTGTVGIFYAWCVGEWVNCLLVFLYILIKNKRFPRNVLDLICLSPDFGARRDLTFSTQVRTDREAAGVSEAVIIFLKKQGTDPGLAMKAGLCLEELATNIVEKGFARDRKKHTVDITVCPEGDIRLIVRDDCLPFDPHDRFTQIDPADPAKGVGIRLVMLLAKSVDYKSIYGLNVLTIRL